MNSSRKKATGNLAPDSNSSRLALALRELANVQDNPASFERFAHLFPTFVSIDDRTSPGWWAAFLRPTIPEFLPIKFAHMYRRREAVRRVWRGDTEMLAMLLLPETPPEETPAEEREAYI